MRSCAWLAVAVVTGITGCRGEEPARDDAPAGRCPPAPRYRVAHVDCGPTPPAEWPDAAVEYPCFWTIDFGANEPDRFTYCYTDVCEGGTFSCVGSRVTGTADSGQTHEGWLDDAGLHWDGLVFSPY